METNAIHIDQYKLDTAFDGDYVIHTYKCRHAMEQENERKDEEDKNVEEEDGVEEVKEKWRQKREIGSGGFGVVYLQEAECGKVRAVKRMPREARNANYSRELATLVEVKDNQGLFVKFIGWYETIDFIFVAMEYIELGDLSQYIKTPDISLHAKEITRQILEGLVILHARKICHRDIKPENILVASLKPIRVKIADFGVSKLEKGTLLHTLAGTAAYCAPEVLRILPKNLKSRNSYTNTVDMWALGCLVHEILTSETPFLDSDLDSTMCSDMDISEPQINLSVVSDFCSGRIDFPVEPLQKSKVDKDGIDFVKKLMVPDPRLRMSARCALWSAWLASPEQVAILQSCHERLVRFVTEEKPGLKAFFVRDDLEKTLVPYSCQAATLTTKLLGMGCPKDIARDLGVLALYDLVLLIDDKKSMGNDPNMRLLKEFLSLVVEIYNLARDEGIRAVRFVNSNRIRDSVKKGDIGEILSKVGVSGDDSYLATRLWFLILLPFIVGSTKTPVVLERPLLTMIVTDSIHKGVDSSLLRTNITGAIGVLKRKHAKGSNFAAFQFTIIGDDSDTQGLFQSLTRDKKIGNNIGYLSASDVLRDEGKTEKNWAGLSKLFLGPLSRAWR